MGATQKKKLDSLPRREATFIEPMECALVPAVPDGPQWIYEISLRVGRDSLSDQPLTGSPA